MEVKGLITEEYANTVIKKRPRDIHKGDCGRVLIVAGTREMAGAAVFSAKACIKAGSGLVFVCTTPQIYPVIQISLPEAICVSWERAEADLAQYDAIAVGPGLGVCSRTEKILEKILTHYKKTIVIDADGLNALAQSEVLKKLLRQFKGQAILTPHKREGARLVGVKGGMDFSREELAEYLTKRYNVIAVVKGAGTIVALLDGSAYINTTGNPGMATAGSGDVLTGVIASLAGQGFAPEDAAKAGVFIHGLAGDLASEEKGEYGITASDIAEHVPFALKKLTN